MSAQKSDWPTEPNENAPLLNNTTDNDNLESQETYTPIPQYQEDDDQEERYYEERIEENEHLLPSQRRLVNRRPGRLLDPDDPAVSPLNLKSVRTLRLTLYIMLVLTFIWAILLFINCFVSIPFIIRLRTSGFLELDMTVVSFISLLIALLFFNLPTRVERVMGYSITTLYFIQFILMWTIPHLRHTYSIVGIVTTGWTWFSFLVALVITPIVVQWGKEHEEVRLTGRRENRRTVTEWLKISLSFLLLNLFVIIPSILFFCGFMLDVYDTTRLITRTGDATVGSFVPVTTTGHHRYDVYIECTPTHKRLNPPLPDNRDPPIVLIEADDRVSAQAIYEGWVEELYNINKVAKVCFWNRPGRGFSDVAPSPFSLSESASALTTALETVLQEENNEDATNVPFQNHSLAIVAHGFGGLYARVFAAQYISSIHSIFLIDTVHEEILRRTIGPIARGFGLWVRGVTSPFALKRQLSWIIHGKGPRFRYLSGLSKVGKGGLAFDTHSSELKASLQEQIGALSGITQNEVEESNAILQGSNIPLGVVASAQSIRNDKEWSGLQKRLGKLTANNVAWEIYDGPHEIWAARKAKEQLQELYSHIVREKRAA
jgi:pimeloyl-ACP methyl ester carboxylesterase